MLPLAAVCVPVLAVLIVGLFDERRYLRHVRRAPRPAAPSLPLPADTAGAPADRSAA